LEQQLSKGFDDYRVSDRALPDSITFAGNGEPTLHPGFFDLVRCVRQLRDENTPAVPLNLFTNGLHIERADVFRALGAFRRIFLKLDGSTPDTLEKLNGAGAWRGTNRALRLASGLDNSAASTMVVGGSIDNTKDVASPAYARMVNLLDPLEVYLYTLDYPTKHSGLEPVPLESMIELAETLSERVSSRIIVLWREHRHPTITVQRKELDVAFA
jgi:wyosine [tRNA(Phe)-imidazoG37] synthetase (radical SAM superfamily)